MPGAVLSSGGVLRGADGTRPLPSQSRRSSKRDGVKTLRNVKELLVEGRKIEEGERERQACNAD